MARVQLGESAAPFAEARARGFLFSFSGWDALHQRLDQYWDEAPSPLLVSGALGSGKATAVRSWLRHRETNPLSTAVLEAGWLHVGRVAAEILLAFGHRPVHDDDAVGALTDFAEDRAEAGEPLFVLIANMHEGPEGLMTDLLELDEQLDLGGQGVHLVMTADLDHWQGADALKSQDFVEQFFLSGLTEGETRRVASAILSAELGRGGPNLSFSDTAIAALHQGSGGLIGLLGSLFDDAVHSAVAAGRSTVLPEDVMTMDAAANRDDGETRSIEEAAQHLFFTASQGLVPSPARTFEFPQFGSSVRASLCPANDTAQPVDDRLFLQLQSLQQETRALEEHLGEIRRTVTALQRRGEERRRVLTARAMTLFDDPPTQPTVR